MSPPVRVLVPTGLGLNCEAETAAAFRLAGAEPDLVHLTDLFAHRHQRRMTDYRILALIGGFAYGDHVAGGFVLATRIRAHLAEDLSAFLAEGGLVLGICNGFQTLVQLGLLPGSEDGAPDFRPRAALTNNDRLGYRNAWVTLGADPRTNCAWTRGLTKLELPARHGEGKLVLPSEAIASQLDEKGRIPLRYLDAKGAPTEAWPHNPNGSTRGAAALSDASGRVLGLMPHQDAYLFPWHHPDYRLRREELEAREPDGLALFRAGVEAARG